MTRAFLIGAPGGIRTPDQVVRSHLLYPAELRVREGRAFNNTTGAFCKFDLGIKQKIVVRYSFYCLRPSSRGTKELVLLLFSLSQGLLLDRHRLAWRYE